MNKQDKFKNLLVCLVSLLTILSISKTSLAGPKQDLLSAISALKGHIDNSAPLSGSQIAAHKATIDSNKTLFGTDQDVMTAVLDLVDTYDSIMGPLWVDGVQRWSGWDRRNVTDDNIHWVIYNVMQYIMDYTYTAGNLAAYESLLGSFKFGSAKYFPNNNTTLTPPADPDAIYTVTINASFPKTFGHDTMHWTERPARKCTGAYLVPGTVATVTVPSSMVNAGYQVRVGAHALDYSNKPFTKRLDRSSLAYDITGTETKVTNPLGGGIYIEVPYQANAGVVDIQIKNTIRGPYYSYNTVTGHITTNSQWQNTERNHPGPWADFQTEKFMMQVPTSWVSALDAPVALMADWDKSMDACNDLMGFEHVRGKESSYDQVDVLIDAGAYSPGYPTCNNTYNPLSNYNGYVNNYLVRGPQNAPSHHFHEIGHGYLFVKFPGEVESLVNLPHVPVWNVKFGMDLDTAFRGSRGSNNQFQTLDTTAICWMMCQNFKNNQPMESIEKQYQLKGHAKYVDIARMFGWEACNQFWYSINVDYENGIYWSRHGSDIDDLLLRWCESAGVDLRPLFHFWGTPPIDFNALKSEIESQNLPPSNAIYDTLVKYKSFVPDDLAAYQDFAFNWWNKQPSSSGYTTERDHALLWDTYDESYADLIRNNVQNIIDLYFPNGRPYLDLGNDMITWSDEPVQLAPSYNNGYSPTSFNWSADPSGGVVFTPNASAATPDVTITKPAGDPLTVKITLMTDGNGQEQDELMIDVYDTACKAAIGMELSADYPTDIDGDCKTNLSDFAELALDWLNDKSLQEPIRK